MYDDYLDLDPVVKPATKKKRGRTKMMIDLLDEDPTITLAVASDEKSKLQQKYPKHRDRFFTDADRLTGRFLNMQYDHAYVEEREKRHTADLLRLERQREVDKLLILEMKKQLKLQQSKIDALERERANGPASGTKQHFHSTDWSKYGFFDTGNPKSPDLKAAIKEKIRKLFALAGNNPNEAEKAEARKLAEKLMKEHGINRSEL